MQYQKHDAAFAELKRAAEQCRHQVNLAAIKICLVPAIFDGRLFFLQRMMNVIGSVITHFRLLKMQKEIKSHDLFIIQDFLNIPLILVWPFIFSVRRKLLFVVNHNVQRCEQSLLEYLCFKALAFFGCRFLLLEFQNERLNMPLLRDATQHLTLPFLITQANVASNFKQKEMKVVGVIGYQRKEKQVDDLLEQVDKITSKLKLKFIVGTPNLAVLKTIKNPNCELIDTTNFENYMRAIKTCDIVVFNYAPYDYYWRHSGIIAECVAEGKYVICPNFPLLRSQVSWPQPVGMCFDNIGKLEETLEAAMKNNPDELTASFAAQRKYRSAKIASGKIDQYIEELP